MECLPGRTLADEVRAGPLAGGARGCRARRHPRGARRRPREGCVAPRHQARQRAARRRRTGEARRLRHRSGRARGSDAHRDGDGHAGVPRARARRRSARDGAHPISTRSVCSATRRSPVFARSTVTRRSRSRTRSMPAIRARSRNCVPTSRARLTAPIMRALATDPADRPQSADEFRRLVAAARAPIAATAPAPVVAARGADRWCSRAGRRPRAPTVVQPAAAEARDPAGDGDRGARRERRHRPRRRDDLVARAERRWRGRGLEPGCAHDGARARGAGAAPNAVRAARALGPAVKRLVLVVVIASAVLFSACGSDDPSMTTAAATALQAQVADARDRGRERRVRARARVARRHRRAHRATCRPG